MGIVIRIFQCLPLVLLASGSLRGQGFPNHEQAPGALLTPLLAPEQGRTAVIAYHNGWLYTVPEMPASQPGSDFLVRRWDLSDLGNVRAVEVYEETQHPVMAHGYLKIGDYLALGDNWPQDQPFSFRAIAPGVNQRSILPGLRGPYDRGDLFQPWHINTYWSYNPEELDDVAVLSRNGTPLATWDHIGETGVIGHPFLIGNLLIFASDQSRTGVATYDVSDPTSPRLLDVLKTGGPGGYWPELWGGNGGLFVVFPYREPVPGIRVVDVSDPTDMRFVADVPLPGAQAMYVQFQDEFAFLGSHKVDMRTISSVLRFDTEGEGVDTSQFLLPLGNLLATGGVGEDQGLAIWAHQAEPDTRGPSVGYHLPRAGQTNYPTGSPITLLIHETLESPTIRVGETLIVRPLGGDSITGRAVFAFNDILTFTPDQPLQADTTYEVVLPAGGIRDVAGNGIEGYSFVFSTGPTVSGNLPPEVVDFSFSTYPARPGESVVLSATGRDPEEGSLEYRFEFGDGSAPSPWSANSSVGHTYDSSGHYSAKVQVRDEQGVLGTAVATVTVSDRIAAEPPPRSSPVVIDGERRVVWAANPDNDTVAAIEADTLEVLSETGVGGDPVSVAIDSAGNAWVACRGGDRIDVVAPGGTTVVTIPLDYGDAPAAIVSGGEKMFVSLAGAGEVVRIDSASRITDGRTVAGPTPGALALSPRGDSLFVARFISAKHHGEVREIDPSTMAVRRVIRLGKLGGDAHRDGTAEGKGVPNLLAGLAVSPGGDRLLVVSNKSNTDRGTLTGPDLDDDNTVRSILTIVETSSGAIEQTVDIDNSDSPAAVCYSPLGDYFFVALRGNDDVLVFDAFGIASSSGLGGFVSRQKIGEAPTGLAVDPATDRLFTKNFLGRSLDVLELEGFTSRGRGDFPKTTVPTVSSERLDEEILLGKRIFHHASDPRMSGEGYLSCATCHPDGGHDGRTWDFTGRGEGLRNTTSLLGKSGLGQGNVHWSANFDEIQDFEHDIRGAFGGTGFLTDTEFASTNTPLGAPKAGLDADLDALAAYVASLGHSSIPKSPYRGMDGSLTNDAAAGMLVFEREGCAACHSGSEFTDGLLHDVGTLRDTSGGRLGEVLPGIETPSLRGIWESPPYLHDGTAESLGEVFSTAGGFSLQAEQGTATGNASIETEWTHLNNDGSVRGGGLGQVWEGGRLVFTDVDGGQGGMGAIEVRYSSGYTSGTLVIRVNGVDHPVTVDPTGNDPDWRYVNWSRVRAEGVLLSPGSSNRIELFVMSPEWLPVGIDEILVSRPEDLAKAEPHRRVLALSETERNELLSFLRQLDGSPTTDSEPPLQPPSAPMKAQLLSQLGEIPLLRWEATAGAESYRVYRSTEPSWGEAELLAETSSVSYRDGLAVAPETYFYWIVAVNAAGPGGPSGAIRREGLLPRPDLSIGRSPTDLVGDDIYDEPQRFLRRVRPGRMERSRLVWQNDGGTDRFQMRAAKSDQRVVLRYFVTAGRRRNVTAELSSTGLVRESFRQAHRETILVDTRLRGRALAKPVSFRTWCGWDRSIGDRVILLIRRK